MMYIGVRSCEVSPEVDNYWGSSKHLPKNVSEICDKFILGTFDTRQDAVADEIRRHNINDVVISDVFWNKAKQTSVGFDTSGTKIKRTAEHNRKIGKANIGRKVSEFCISQIKLANTGRVPTQETRDKISQASTGRKHTTETKQKIGKANRGNKHTEETKRKLSESLKGNSNFLGKKHTEASKLKMSNSRKALEKVACPHCDVVSLKSLMARWHFDNCKYKGGADEHTK